MYPANYFGLFPAFPREQKVFVAMGFDREFDDRWNNVIAPAIETVKVNDLPLKANRVDQRMINDSIMTEILDGIGNNYLIFVDITSLHEINGKAVRNANVMYELGLANARRLPEEVVVFRSDDFDLPFDTKDFRVNSYDPEHNPIEAQRKIKNVLESTLKEID